MRKRVLGRTVLFLFPGLIFLGLFFVAPAVITIAMSFTGMTYRLKWDFNGLANYLKIVKDFLIPKILLNTTVYVLGTQAFFTVTLALILAIFTTTINRRAGVFYRAVWLLPRFLPPIVYATAWLWMLSPTEKGLFNVILSIFGFQPVSWIVEHPWIVIIVVNGFVGASFGMIIFAAAITSISEDYSRAARVDGASWLQEIIYIIIPMIRWPLAFVTAYNTLSLLTSYEYIMLVTDGGPFYASEVWALYSYHQAFGIYEAGSAVRFGYGAALATLMVVVGTIASIVYWRVLKFGAMMEEPKIEID